jgi:hypothetical protein
MRQVGAAHHQRVDAVDGRDLRCPVHTARRLDLHKADRIGLERAIASVAAPAASGHAARAARRVAKPLDESRGVGPRLHARRDHPVHPGVEDGARAGSVGQAHESGGSRGPRADGEGLHVAHPERAVLEVDPDEVNRTRGELG